jgi:hypothetical protein
MIAFLLLIGRSILQEFGENLQKIGIKNSDYITKREDFITNEAMAFVENLHIFKEAFEIFKNCFSAYKIIQTTYDREPNDPIKTKAIIDVLDKVRYFCGEVYERFKVIERNYQSTVIILLLFY